MIARILIPIILILLLSDWCIDRLILRRFTSGWGRIWRKVLWSQTVLVVAYSTCLALSRNFAPDNALFLDVYFLLLGMLVMPKAVFAGCYFLGWAHCWYHKTKTNWGSWVGVMLAAALCLITLYGYTLGSNTVEVRRITYTSADLPREFDGYRIVQFSDAHVGTFSNWKGHVLEAAIDSINNLHPDLIAFTGDLQNMRPEELPPHARLLSSMHGKDGVVSVLGNHDYAYYLDVDDSVRQKNLTVMKEFQQRMGWRLLCNEHFALHRGGDSIVVAGMEFEGKSKKVPNHGNLKSTLSGVDAKAFILMLQHDPTAWRTDILPNSSAQLTLSGHTHATQLKVFGWSPASLLYTEWGGFYHEGSRAINVSTGLGGFIPFRLGVPGEVVEITLKCGTR